MARHPVHAFGRLCVGALLALSLAACGAQGTQEPVAQGSSQPSGSTSQQAEPAISSSSSESTPAPAYSYFDECPELARPDSVIDCTLSDQRSHDAGGWTQYVYEYAVNGDDDTAQVQGYVDAIAGDGVQVYQDGEAQWSAVIDGKGAAGIQYDAATKTLTLLVVSDAGRQNVSEIALNQTVETDSYTLTLTGVEWAKSFQFNDVWGMGEESGSTYCIVRGTLKNTGSTALDLYDTWASFRNMNGIYQYSGSVDSSDGSTVDPLQEVTVFFYASIPDELANNFQGGTLVFCLDDVNDYRMSLT